MKKTQHIKLILKGCAVGLKYFTYTDEKFNMTCMLMKTV
jgi:hypothetical protein